MQHHAGQLDADLIDHLAEYDTPCPGCSYNLRGLTTRHCPECGEPIDVDRLIRHLEGRHAFGALRGQGAWAANVAIASSTAYFGLGSLGTGPVGAPVVWLVCAGLWVNVIYVWAFEIRTYVRSRLAWHAAWALTLLMVASALCARFC